MAERREIVPCVCGEKAHPVPDYYAHPTWTVKCSKCKRIGPSSADMGTSVAGWKVRVEGEQRRAELDAKAKTCPTCGQTIKDEHDQTDD